jgi:glutathionyl-hydroquinone reductase
MGLKGYRLWDMGQLYSSYRAPTCTATLRHIKTHYFTSHPVLNANAIVPVVGLCRLNPV